MHTCHIQRGELYLPTSHAALLFQPASIGAVCSPLAAFPSLSPLPLLHPPSFTLSTVWTSLTSGCSLRSISLLQAASYLIICPVETACFSLLYVFPSHADDI